ncbi:MAG: YbaB/EbfC family nucleoid-associated protein [Lachnospiraceae bacterium]|nr:YbaB/EbfC family nucleoid-associated protein [Lachnospiraceae bacterium]
MSKRGAFRGGGMPGGMNNIMKQAQKMQQKMEEAQKQVEELEVSASSGGGAVEVTVLGNHEIKSVKLNEEVVDPEDIEMLEDLIVAAANEAMRTLNDESAALMSQATGGLGGGGLGDMLGGGLPF